MNTSPDDLAIIEEQAADWLLLLEEQKLSVSNSQHYPIELQDWLTQGDLHREIFQKMQQLWQVSTQLDSDYVAQQLGQLPATNDINKRAEKRSRLGYFALAAAFFLLSFTVFINVEQPSNKAVTVANNSAAMSNVQNQFFRTTINEHRTITLADNSRVDLGANSQLAVRYSNSSRELTLYQGEALFSVAKDKQRPFIVRHQQSQVEALGTVFNVRANPDSIRVDVLEGIVSLAQQQVIKLSQGQAAQVTQSGTITRSKAQGENLIMDWQQGRLVYQNARLGDVLNDVARYSEIKITLRSQQLSQYTYNGSLYTSEIDSWLHSLDKIYPITVTQQGKEYTLTVN
ncbi:hypothetical protein CWB85_00870 [Pseudoalteromonas sp. S1727]|uniref:FecR family protein n=1 Tax=Pseudoalteromonas sp. S1727 TaxID=2066514 RepID=UPI001107EE0E|nr:FecR domain-containing protein [Pseudoalteromonas sp. S1727]TMN74449.1 hypothetical protein CWB85_00870 [Pseudoalteromonas sp. S1727]